MNIQERIEALETEFNEKIKTLKEEAQQRDEFPKRGEKYYFIESSGDVGWFLWGEYGFCLRAQDIGNIYKTEEQAEFTVEKLKVEAELRKFSRPFERGSLNFLMCFDTDEDKIYIETKRFMVQGAFYFESILQLDEAIKSVGVERIKKYIFGVEGLIND